MLGDHRRNIVERLEGAFSLADGSRPARHEREEGLAVPLLPNERERMRNLRLF
jgi:hypothetical protein